jgi:hypothetical protein
MREETLSDRSFCRRLMPGLIFVIFDTPRVGRRHDSSLARVRKRTQTTIDHKAHDNK